MNGIGQYKSVDCAGMATKQQSLAEIASGCAIDELFELKREVEILKSRLGMVLSYKCEDDTISPGRPVESSGVPIVSIFEDVRYQTVLIRDEIKDILNRLGI